MTTPVICPNSDENIVLLSKFYPPGVLSLTTQQQQQQQGELAKTRRRRRRNSKGGETRLLGAKKRKLTSEQVSLLEVNFGSEHKLETERKDKLALELGLHPRQVAIWFQNRRARYKNKQLEEEYMNLKKNYDTVLLKNCTLESENLNLKQKLAEFESDNQRLIQQQLAETDKEIKKLTEGCGENSHNSPSPQFTIETEEDTAADTVTDTPFLDDCVPMPSLNVIKNDHDHDHDHREPNQPFYENRVVEEQPRQDGSDVTDNRGNDGFSDWTVHYGGFMMGNVPLWNYEHYFNHV